MALSARRNAPAVSLNMTQGIDQERRKIEIGNLNMELPSDQGLLQADLSFSRFFRATPSRPADTGNSTDAPMSIIPF